MSVHTTVPGIGTQKIDSLGTDGLDGVYNSLAYRVAEIEDHLHNRERWMGVAAAPNAEVHAADDAVMAPLQIDAGDDTWGAWVCIIGSTDTPVIAGMEYFDFHRLVFDDVETDKINTRIQFAYGASGAAAFGDGDYTEVMLKPQKAVKQEPVSMIMPRVAAGVKAFARCWVAATNTSTIDFFVGLHEYEG